MMDFIATMDFFTVTFYALVVLCVAIQLSQRTGRRDVQQSSPEFKNFQHLYLFVYSCCVIGDWLQGPYVYALYDYYKFTKQQIGFLFIAGFGSSAFFGVFIGQYADKYGRKKACLLYVVLYIVSCATKHSPDFWILMFGRLTGGAAISILYSAFESWMVAEHNRRAFPVEWSNQTFSLATVGNGVCAIVAGWLGALVEHQFHSFVAPFDLAVLFFAVAGAVIWAYWTENKGHKEHSEDTDSPGTQDTRSTPMVALQLMREDTRVLLLAAIQSCFEATMFIFIFMWTPKMEPLFKPLPHGQVFGCFMVCMMIGSSLVDALMKYLGQPQQYLRWVFLLGAACMFAAAFSSEKYVCVVSFFVFEALCGVYWPSKGIIKSIFVPEEVRATVYNLMRVPLNLMVVIVLANIGTFSDDTVFIMCGILLTAAAVMQHAFVTIVNKQAGTGSVLNEPEATELGSVG